MNDDDLLKRFELDGQRIESNWSLQTRTSFLDVARQVHDAGWDWYWIIGVERRPQLRFGRKEPRRNANFCGAIRNHRTDKARFGFALRATSQLPRTPFDLLEGVPADLGEKLRAIIPASGSAKTRTELARQPYWPDQLRDETMVIADTEPELAEEEFAEDKFAESAVAVPVNRILYGPPGTGKTFATARHAVALIEGDAWLDLRQHDDAAVRARYREFVEARQIEFVTFHQSYAYEDFVEGLRPTLGNEDEEAPEPKEGDRTPAGGFGLRPIPGVFHRISTRAERARLAAVKPVERGARTFELGKRRVFKMSIGRAGYEDHLFDAAIAGGYTALGWSREEDWSDPKYRNYDEIYKRVNELRPGTQGNAGDIAQVWRFREMNVGDVIVVSQGNYLARAIGIVAGDYEYEPHDPRNYEHRRKVDWLVVPTEPIPVSEIYKTSFTQASCYQLRPEKLNVPALERLLSEGQVAPAIPVEEGAAIASTGRPNQFVLIIDEINRANVSKVLGELITLLEPDKRLGQKYPLTVTLPYSGKPFGVPNNLHVLGTMNTADRSIALLDTALRRRFEFIELMPDSLLLPEELDGVPLRRLLTSLNERIEYLFDREHQIGHTFFIECRSRSGVDDVMRRKVLPLLAEYFYEDWSRIAAVLGDADGRRFLIKTALPAPPGLRDDGVIEPRMSWKIREGFAQDAYDAFR